MAAHWITAVRNLWVDDEDIDFAALENEWQLKVFETSGGEPTPDNRAPERGRLLCCMTGFEDPEVRQEIVDKIQAHGGNYTGDLSKKVSHLIVYKPEGKKYQAAKNWNIHTVSVEWVHDSVERGLILDERCYDPILSPEERGVGAWNRDSIRRVKLGKRLRETATANQEEGRRKLRKTASMKLNSQRDNLWGDILRKPELEEPASEIVPAPAAVTELAARRTPAPSTLNQPNTAAQQQSAGAKSMDTQETRLSSFGAQDDSFIFASCCFYIHDFEQKKSQILSTVIGSLGGIVCHSLDEVVSTSGAQLAHRFLVVPQSSAPESHPPLPDNVHIITEFYIERCMHNKSLFDPDEHVIGRPFPAFPIPGFERLVICTAGFTGVDLNQVDKAIRQLGGKYEEKFTAQASVLVCSSLDKVRPQKLDLAVAWKVPVVSSDWLWECISTGFNVPSKGCVFPEIRERLGLGSGKSKPGTKQARDSIDKDLLPKAQTANKSKRRGFDVSAFTGAFKESSSKTPETAEPAASTDNRARSALALEEQESHATTDFETAPTHQLQFNTASNLENSTSGKCTGSAPLSEASNNSLNKTPRSATKQGKTGDPGTKTQLPSPPQQSQPARKPMSRITSEIADSEATDGDIGTPDEVPLPIADENQVPPQKADDPAAAERRRIEAEKEAERLALATRLASIIESAAPATSVVATESRSEDQVPVAGGLTRVLSGSGLSSGGSGTTRRRKREILGRAISNVSAASSGSADSANGNNPATNPPGSGRSGGGLKRARSSVVTPLTVAAPLSDSDTAAAVAAAMVSDGPTGAADSKPASTQNQMPASTQLEYKDPEAKLYKAKVMHKMLDTVAEKNGGTKQGSFSDKQHRQEKLTLGDLGGYDTVGQQQQQYGDGPGRRTTRRRG